MLRMHRLAVTGRRGCGGAAGAHDGAALSAPAGRGEDGIHDIIIKRGHTEVNLDAEAMGEGNQLGGMVCPVICLAQRAVGIEVDVKDSDMGQPSTSYVQVACERYEGGRL